MPATQRVQGAIESRSACERAFWDCGAARIAGVDEVGRGALAGPLVAAAVILPAKIHLRPEWERLVDVNDSKLIRPEHRRRLATDICAVASAIGIGIADVSEIDSYGISAGNRLAMERAVTALPVEPDALVIDAAVTDLALPQVGLIDGDARSISVAAASIIAKVTRDRFMDECDGADTRYGFRFHKGYGTAMHLAALRRFGPCWLHRRSFAPVARCGEGVGP
jgi:ribonuclease HII